MLRRSYPFPLNSAPLSLITTAGSRTSSSTLSPYAAALKHIAIKGGSAAFGPSAIDDDLRMSRAGVLPADYRPPPTTAWDDTIERWAYAWQFPVAEALPTQSTEISKLPAIQGVIDIATRLLESPPSKLPRPQTRKVAPEIKNDVNEENDQIGESSGIGGGAESLMDSLAATDHEAVNNNNNDKNAIAEETSEESFTTISALEYQKLLPPDSFLPVAYLDDGSEFSAVCKELGTIMVEELNIPFDPSGIKSVIAAVGKLGKPQEALALFRFVVDAGFEASTILYGATMLGFAMKGQVQPCHDLVEEMKESGITPDRSVWHTLIIAYNHAKDYGAMLQIVENMKAYANVEPDETTFAYQLQALGKDTSRESNVYEAVQIFDQMENVYGFIPNRTLYHALMSSLCRSKDPAMQQKLSDISQKMELLGIPWNSMTYFYLLKGCTTMADVEGARNLCAKMRNEGLSMTIMHLSAVLRTYSSSVTSNAIRINKESRERGDQEAGAKEIADICQKNAEVVAGIIDLVKSRKSWMQMSPQFVDAWIGFTCNVVDALARYAPDGNGEMMVQFEDLSKKIWMEEYTSEDSVTNFYDPRNDQVDDDGNYNNNNTPIIAKSPYTYSSYISMLASQQRIDEAENLFQELTMVKKQQPVRQTYENLIIMHLTSGEEGSSHRALSYMDAMKKSGLTVRPAFLKRMTVAAEEASYRRDMKRRMRRIVQAREEYIARKQQEEERQGFESKQEDLWGDSASKTKEKNENNNNNNNSLTTTSTSNSVAKSHHDTENLGYIAPFQPNKKAGFDSIGTVQTWWKHWEKNSVSKHELFEDADENPDGTPAGESFEEKNKALRKLGIDSKFLQKSDLPNPKKNILLNKIRSEENSEPAASLWNLDDETGAENRPTTPTGWTAMMWRERQILRKELEKIKDGLVSDKDKQELMKFSSTGNAVRTAPEQLAIENSGASTFGELQDVRQFPDSVYDDGTAKPPSEVAAPVGFSGELVWQNERKDPLAPFKETSELHPDSENIFLSAAEKETREKVDRVIDSIQNKREDEDEIVGTMTKRKDKSKKVDFLEKWRDLYRQGVLEMKDEPLWDMRDPATNKANAMRAALGKTGSTQRAYHSMKNKKNNNV